VTVPQSQPTSAAPHDTTEPASPAPDHSPTLPVSSSRPTLEGKGVGILHVLWALLPVLSFGILTPVPFVHAAVRLRDRRLWLITAAYTSAWLALLTTMLVTVPKGTGANAGTSVPSGTIVADVSSMGFDVAFPLSLALAVAATVHAFVLRSRVFPRPSPPISP
jgi:hypothetical protein